MTDPISWEPVRAFVRHRLAGIGPVPDAGSTAWTDLDDDDPQKIASVIRAGERWALEEELRQLDDAKFFAKQAAIDISQALPWAQVAKQIAARNAFYRAHPDLRRKAS
ncbi:DUF2742 domain-containing protein [Gordonia alkaliphila]|uniref:DUF2742 domain-containing protein n=1 Tax=Gordonia alkaliphila TaxID=1053547 RepID=A0ABP8Z4W5_9ACTN